MPGRLSRTGKIYIVIRERPRRHRYLGYNWRNAVLSIFGPLDVISQRAFHNSLQYVQYVPDKIVYI